ncbi:MAG: hypothetical protein IT429_06805, partial [Gemmataceae bacterium]|nr:hypothetical protein [Gemmataceae bacterium]
KVGFRLLNNTGIIFDNCRIPKSFVLGEVDRGKKLGFDRYGADAILSQDYPYTFGIRLGAARSAFEEAAEYAKMRVQGGKPIVEHQAVAMKLGEMYSLVESLRAMMYRFVWMNSHPEELDKKYGPMMFWYCAESVVRIVTLAMQVTGCGGTWLSLYGQKHLRDGVMSYGGGGTHTVQLLRAMSYLASEAPNAGAARIAAMRKP